ncbi:hypothetical protein [Mycobacterium tuberculosis]|uniref:hypothetical protein n=1 Tax=Mycobacterium tuberculosis TaxID=1773 RepID=UPI00272AA4D0|nr:hypothetical protein [Mycobacterium tuberculosis]
MAELVELAGGPSVTNAAYVGGGPMMGHLLHDLSDPVTKTTSASLPCRRSTLWCAGIG